MKKKWMYNILLILFVLVFVASGVYLFRYFMGAKQTENELTELQQLKIESASSEDETSEVIQTENGNAMLKEYRKLYKKNRDIIGWVLVKGTQIDYPVMQTKDDSEYYLHRNFHKKQDENGMPFLDAKCDTNEKKGNLMIYGHHMKSGLMFAHLEDYENKEFYQKHKVIQFDTLYEKREYEIVAVFRSQVYEKEEDVFKYYQYRGKLSKKQYNTYVKNCKKLSVHDTGVEPVYGEQLLTLVTCAYHTDNGRFVVVARRKK